MTYPTREEVAQAIDDADKAWGYSIQLTRLVDGETTYTLSIPGLEPTEHASHSEAIEVMTAERDKRRADAILALFQVPTPLDDGVRERVEAKIASLHKRAALQRDDTYYASTVSDQEASDLRTLLAAVQGSSRDHAPASGSALDCYDAGLLGDYGGGNVEWWHDYLRAELARAHDFYSAQIPSPPPAVQGAGEQCERCQGNGEIVTDWERYLKPEEGAPGDAGTETCPTCGGSGDAPATEAPDATASLKARVEELEGALRCVQADHRGIVTIELPAPAGGGIYAWTATAGSTIGPEVARQWGQLRDAALQSDTPAGGA